MLHLLKTKKSLKRSDQWVGNYRHFSEAEMVCRCGCGELPKHSFMVKLVLLRRLLGVPLRITSGQRCIEHNKSIGGGVVHPMGLAADIQASGLLAIKIVVYGYLVGFRGFGISQKGSFSSRFIHIDMWVSSKRPAIWSY